MKVLLQWTLANPTGWQFIDSSNWDSLPVKPEPVGGEAIDDNPGWVYALNVQGLVFHGDHYAVIHDDPNGGCTVICWNDDPGDYAAAQYFGHASTFLPLAPDPKFQNRYNTKQTRSFYGGDTALQAFSTAGISALPWNRFKVPAKASTIHGIWISDTLAAEHDKVRSLMVWRDWSEGVPITSLNANGQVI